MKITRLVLYILEVILIFGVLAMPMPHSTKLAYLIVQESKSPSEQGRNALTEEQDRLARSRNIIRLILLVGLTFNSVVLYKYRASS